MKTLKSFLKLAVLPVALFVSFCSSAQNPGANYIRGQYINPIGQYSDFYSQGFGVEYGHTFYFDVVMGDLFTPGIDVTFMELGFNSGKTYDYMYETGSVADSLHNYKTQDGFLMTAGPKIGLAVQMELIDGLCVAASAKYCPTLVFGTRTLGRSPLHPKEERAGCFAFSNRFSINLELKYQWFSFGGEFLFGKANLDYNKDIIPDLASTPVLQDKADLGMNTFKLYIGFNF
ncbi:MAG: hypothetical protein ACI3Z9_07560 [Candidatus Onthomorpha sp.]